MPLAGHISDLGCDTWPWYLIGVAFSAFMYFSTHNNSSIKTFSDFLVRDLVKFLSLTPLVNAVMATVWSKSLTYSILLLNLVTNSFNGSSYRCRIDIRVNIFLWVTLLMKWLTNFSPKSLKVLMDLGGNERTKILQPSSEWLEKLCSKEWCVSNATIKLFLLFKR